MPFTPFHFGPGLLIKSAAPEQVSFTAFAVTQGFIDCEPLYYMLRHEYPIHRQLHTLVGATAVGLAVAGAMIVGRRMWPALGSRLRSHSPLLASEVSTAGILVGALLGAVSHSLLDAVVHPDVHPFSPWTRANPLLGLVSTPDVYLGCVLTGLAGAAILWIRERRTSAAGSPAEADHR